jgi:hypothetical protein
VQWVNHATVTHRIGGWVGPTCGPKVVAKREIPALDRVWGWGARFISVIVVLTGTVGLLFEQTVTNCVYTIYEKTHEFRVRK